jgi:hypothetical protein
MLDMFIEGRMGNCRMCLGRKEELNMHRLRWMRTIKRPDGLYGYFGVDNDCSVVSLAVISRHDISKINQC